MSVYNYGVTLNPVPTGFGMYTGIAITNNGNFPTEYSASISDTTFDGSVTALTALDGNIYNTIYLTDDPINFDKSDQTSSKSVKVSNSGLLYVFHKPFNTFEPGMEGTGLEFSTITINSISSAGDADSPISISVSGQRIITHPTPSKLGNFYAIKGGDSLEFHWQSILSCDYFTGFDLDLSLNSSFSSLVSIPEYTVNDLRAPNTDINYPTFGHYSGFKGIDYELTIDGLSYGQDYYARLRPINVAGGYGPYVYCTGYNTRSFKVNGSTYSGIHPSPGENLRSELTRLDIVYHSDAESDFDIFNLIVENNNNSTNFQRYSGVNIKFFPKSNNVQLSEFTASATDKGALNFIPDSSLGSFTYGVGVGGTFDIEIELENIGLFGHNGSAGLSLGNGSFSSPGNGGPILNFSPASYSDGATTKSVQFHIYKDADSVLYAGAAGGNGVTVTENNDSNNTTSFNGGTTVHVKTVDLSQYVP